MEIKSKKASKTVSFTLNDDTLKMLKELAERNSNTMSYEVRRLIRDEYRRQNRQ
jgi:predicted transcriptional regulator